MDARRKLSWIAAVALIFAIAGIVYVTKAFVTTILLSVFFAYILIPAYSRLFRITKRKRLSSLLSILLVFVIFTIFTLNVISALSTEISELSLSQESINLAASGFISQSTGDLFGVANDLVNSYVPKTATPYATQLIDQARGQMESFLRAPTSGIIQEVLPRAARVLTEIATGIASNLPILVAQFGVAILLTYYLLIDGGAAIERSLPLFPEEAIVRQFISELNSIYNSLFSVYLTTSLITGLIAAVGFTLLGIPYPFLWGMATAIFAFLPLIGSTTIFVPLSLYYLATQDYTRGAAILVFGFIFLNLVPENLLRPRLAMRGASIHPAITLLAFAAPLFVVGVIGIIVGPGLYGFVLAAYRTRIRMLEPEPEPKSEPEGPVERGPET